MPGPTLCRTRAGDAIFTQMQANVHTSTIDRHQLAARGGRGSRKAASGVPTPVVSADQLLCGQSASFFNIDVEGAEREAILGAAETIRRCRPKLLLAAYHRSEDLFALPQLVFSIRSDYQLYLRHHQQLPAWDVNFYFV